MKRKFVWLVCLLALPPSAAEGQHKGLQARRVRNPRVAYAPAERVKTFPLPAVNFVREGLARPSDVKELLDGLVYPLVNRSPRPVAAVVVTFTPDSPSVTVLVLWHDTAFKDVLVERDARGHFRTDAYKIFLEDDTEEP